MLPPGGAHIPCKYSCSHCVGKFTYVIRFLIVKGVAKIARKLGLDYGEAVVRWFASCYPANF